MSIRISSMWLLVLMSTLALVQPGLAKKSPPIPAPLQPWVDWVLYGTEEQLTCIPRYNDPDTLQCDWPTALELHLHEKGGDFRQAWLVHSDRWVALPGDNSQWPQDVRVDGAMRIIIQKDSIPRVRLRQGMHAITGSFSWQQLPEDLQIPSESALVSLTVNNEEIPFPNLDTAGRLWLKRELDAEKIENRLKIESFRLIDDLIPPQVLLSFTIDVAGSAREILLGPLYPPGTFTPLSLQSPLPAKLEQDGSIRVQVRPGQYNLSLRLRHRGPLYNLSFSHPKDGFWPQQEIWSFRAQPDLRLVEIEGVPSIDPLQTAVPKDWRQYPAYRLLPGESMLFKEGKRGDPQPAPDQLTLHRNLWLRFDGSGYTIQDSITGQKNTNWRLESNPALTLGRVAVDGIEQLITHRKGSDKTGVELRNGIVSLTADSVYQGKLAVLPATGWDHDFQKVEGSLYLPPGWKLLNATGIDNIPRTWINRWTLLDFFVVLIFTIALAKLFSKPLACIAFITLTLLYHEPGAPRYIWLALLIGFALLKYLPDGSFKKAVTIYQRVATLALVVIVIPYAIESLRIGIYPQLAMPWASMTDYTSQEKGASPGSPETDMMQEMSSPTTAADSVASVGKLRDQRKEELSPSSSPGLPFSYYESRVMQYDPKALTQTGPGLPQWLPFETVRFDWSGPVTRDQTVTFTLIGPATNLILAFARVVLIIILALGIFGIRYGVRTGFHHTGTRSLKLFSFLVILLLFPTIVHSTEIPSPEILDELRKRFLEKDDCFPGCADISDVAITITHNQVSIIVHTEAQLDSAIPLPSHVKYWLPQQVLIDETPAGGLLRKGEGLWMLVPAGKHTLRLSGSIRKQNTLQLPFPLKPHRASIKADGWSVEGVHPDGSFDTQLQFKRHGEGESKQAEILETGILPPFVLVERTILLGLVWKIETRVQRLSPAGSGVVLEIPLLPGESVTTEGVRVTEGIAKINLPSDQSQISWESFLEPTDRIVLKHKDTDAWTETWKVDVSPVFHLDYEGIPVILHKTGMRWYPMWHPWPGESVSLTISRPEGITGQTLTIEKSHLELRPGKNTTAATMTLSIKSSQGGQHNITLPLDAELQEVKIRGEIQPIRQTGRNVGLPVTPGQQDIELKWLETKGMTNRYQSSDVDLGAPSVNASVDIFLPRNRWPLFVGGEQLVGPAVLFWSVLIIIVLVAFGLSKTGLTPLRFYQWFLLGIGMSMSTLPAGLVVSGWLIALELRKKAVQLKANRFNLVQVGLALLTLTALGALVVAISKGLLGHPDMNIIGNGSDSGLLRWYQDVSDSTLPRAWVFSIPMLAYRIAMLAWALWISFWLVGILKWGWQQCTAPRIWYR